MTESMIWSGTIHTSSAALEAARLKEREHWVLEHNGVIGEIRGQRDCWAFELRGRNIAPPNTEPLFVSVKGSVKSKEQAKAMVELLIGPFVEWRLGR